MVLEYSKRQFPGLYCLKKKVGKKAIFEPKPWVKPFGKMGIFGVFDLLVLIAKKGVFFVVEYRKRHFFGLYSLNKKFGKMAILGLKPWVNPFGKMSSFGLFELLVFIAQKRSFLVLKYLKKHSPDLYCLKQKVEKMAIFGPKPWVNPFGKMSDFGLFKLLVFIA